MYQNKCSQCGSECDATELVTEDGREVELCPDCADEAEARYFTKGE
jgi:ribosome-binding protein aMBF1 (putative translation factor)